MGSSIMLLVSIVSKFRALGLRCPLVGVQLKPAADQSPPAG